MPPNDSHVMSCDPYMTLRYNICIHVTVHMLGHAITYLFSCFHKVSLARFRGSRVQPTTAAPNPPTLAEGVA
eukprot:m.1661574 g.1661574  ORF g.1661574 m.1661574 type:complete len:72 (+) comp125853_c0_seq1:232-447(+)